MCIISSPSYEKYLDKEKISQDIDNCQVQQYLRSRNRDGPCAQESDSLTLLPVFRFLLAQLFSFFQISLGLLLRVLHLISLHSWSLNILNNCDFLLFLNDDFVLWFSSGFQFLRLVKKILVKET